MASKLIELVFKRSTKFLGTFDANNKRSVDKVVTLSCYDLFNPNFKGLKINLRIKVSNFNCHWSDQEFLPRSFHILEPCCILSSNKMKKLKSEKP